MTVPAPSVPRRSQTATVASPSTAAGRGTRSCALRLQHFGALTSMSFTRAMQFTLVLLAAIWGVAAGTALHAQTAQAGATVQVASGFMNPVDVDVDRNTGNVFVADQGNNAVDEIVAVNGQVSSTSTVTAVGQTFLNPNGVAVDSSGNVFVADNSGVSEIVAVNGAVSSSSTVTPLPNSIAHGNGVAVDRNGDLFVTAGPAVYEIVAPISSQSNTVIQLASGFQLPIGVAVHGGGHIFVADSQSGQGRRRPG